MRSDCTLTCKLFPPISLPSHSSLPPCTFLTRETAGDVLFSYLHHVLLVGTTATMTMDPLGGVMKDIPVVLIPNTGAWRVVVTPIVTMAPLRGMTKGVPTMTMTLLGGVRGEVATTTPTLVTMVPLRVMMKGTTTDTIRVLMIIMLDKEALRIVMSRTEGEMNCQKVCVCFGSEEGEAHM